MSDQNVVLKLKLKGEVVTQTALNSPFVDIVFWCRLIHVWCVSEYLRQDGAFEIESK